jgi:hypothetical protein
MATVVLALVAKLPDSTADLSPWNHWRMPVVVKEVASDLHRGPVLVTAEYIVVPGKTAEFVEAIQEYGRIRLRDGAYRWGIYRDTEAADRYVEIFLVHSWAEHLRQHERQTNADRKIEERLLSNVAKDPQVHHLIYASGEET